MSVTREHLQHLCKLAALNLTEEQMAKFGPQLDSIVGLVSKLESLDLGQIHTVSHIVGHVNDSVVSTDFDMMSNIHHPIVGNMPAVSFSTREES